MSPETVEKALLAHAADISVMRILLAEIALLVPDRALLLRNFQAAIENFSEQKPAQVSSEHVVEVRARAATLANLIKNS